MLIYSKEYVFNIVIRLDISNLFGTFKNIFQRITIEYFFKNKDKINKTILYCTDFRHNVYDISDPLLCAVLSVEAESVGVSLEEYVERFLDAFYQDPTSFNLLIFQNNKLK